MKTYKIRKFQNGKNKSGDPFINYSLTIPSVIAEALPSDVQFACELTDEGILFRPAKAEVEQVALPAWAKTNGTPNGNAAPVEDEPEAEAPEAPAPEKKGRRRPAPKATAAA